MELNIASKVRVRFRALSSIVHLHCLLLDGVYRSGGDGVPTFVEVAAPSDDELHTLLHTLITSPSDRRPDTIGGVGLASPSRRAPCGLAGMPCVVFAGALTDWKPEGHAGTGISLDNITFGRPRP